MIPLKLNESKNIKYYPSSNKEWYNSVYSFNKLYIKPLIARDMLINNLFKNYFNMVEHKIKRLFKRQSIRNLKIRYSANRIYVSRAEIKHTNDKLFFIVYIYNKQKSKMEQYMRNIVKFKTEKNNIDESNTDESNTGENNLNSAGNINNFKEKYNGKKNRI